MADDNAIKHGSRFKDISGLKFGRLMAESFAFKRGIKLFWNCLCECGNHVILPIGNISNGHTKSCGCLNVDRIIERNTKHGLWKSSEFSSWMSAKDRCFNPAEQSYKHYGGRGITMCDRWKNSFAAFFEDMGQKPTPNHTLDRIDNDGHYQPGNCRWATHRQQMANRRNSILITHKGETLCLAEWSRKLEIHYGTLLGRYMRNPEHPNLLGPPRKGNFAKKR